MNAAWFGFNFVVSAAIIWCAFGPRVGDRRVKHKAKVPVGPPLDLLADPIALLEGVQLREVVRWDDELLVGFDGTQGSWIEPDHVSQLHETPKSESRRIARGQIRFPRGAHDRRTRRLLKQWQNRMLVAVVARDGTLALIDLETREALLGENVWSFR
jgi:hypothetical protein